MDAFEVIRADRVVAVVRGERVADPARLAETLSGAGIRSVELTFTIPDVLAAIEAAATAETGAVIGAGTVTRAEQARQAVEAGARFIVSPIVSPEVVGPAREAGVPVFLGGLTPTEVHAAVVAGATAVKLFPASVGGPRYITDLRGPFPNVSLLPAGGVTPENARAFLEAGALAVFAGSGLTPPDLVASGDFAEISRRAHAFVAALS